VYLVSYTIVYINPRQADEMTPSPGPIAKIQMPTSKIFQNLTPEVSPNQKVNPRGARVIPEIPMLNDLPPVKPNFRPQSPSLPTLPKIL